MRQLVSRNENEARVEIMSISPSYPRRNFGKTKTHFLLDFPKEERKKEIWRLRFAKYKMWFIEKAAAT